MMVGSGCATKGDFIEPLCLPDRPTLVNITNEDKWSLREANPTAYEALAVNDNRLKGHVETIEDIVRAHNEQFKAECVGDSE